MNDMHYIVTKKNDELYHHGIPGMHWGVRRYQNPDGTLTREGKARLYSKKLTGLSFDYSTLNYNRNRKHELLLRQQKSLERASHKHDDQKIEKRQQKVNETTKDLESIEKRRKEIASEIQRTTRKVLDENMSFTYKDVFRRPTTRTTMGRKTAYNILATSGSMLTSPFTFNTFERTTKYKVNSNRYLKDGSRMRNKTSFLTDMHPVNEIIYVAR